MEQFTDCPTRYFPKAGWRRMWHMFRYSHADHSCGFHTPISMPHVEHHVCGCGFTWPSKLP